jgi:tocopherol cyclase-like protein
MAGMDSREQDNRIRWDPKSRAGHVESLFLKANDLESERAFWLKYTILARPGRPVECSLWAIAFDGTARPVGAKQTYPVERATHRDAPFSVAAPDFSMDRSGVKGTIASGGHTLRFDLRHTELSGPHRPFPWPWMYEAGFPRFKILTPYPSERFSGSLEVDGRVWVVEGWPGMQGHNWGRAHSERYAWAHCSAFEKEPESWFEGFSAKIRLGPVATPFLTMAALHHEGRLWTPLSMGSFLAPVEVEHTRWRFRTPGRGFVLSGEVTASVDRMAGLVYENPTGGPSQCLNSKLSRCVVRLERPGLPTVELRSEHGAALEVLVRETTHPIPMLL